MAKCKLIADVKVKSKIHMLIGYALCKLGFGFPKWCLSVSVRAE